MTARAFHLGDVLSVTTGRLVSPNHIAGIHELLKHMAGEPIWIHQLPRVADEAGPRLLAQHPQLAEVQVPDDFGPDPETALKAWLDDLTEQYGETLQVEPMAGEDHTSIDPLDELGLLGVGPDRIITVVIDPEAGS